jgi:predicted DCC family thiol-disulfide oxidoreductase YuxK
MPRPPHRAPSPAVVLYDGDCPLCQRTVRFARQRDRRGRLRFLALQSPQARDLLARHGIPPGDLDSVVLVEADRLSLRSTAVLRLCRHLSMPWPLAACALLLPRWLRDRCYDFVARRRRRLLTAAER